MILIIIIVKQSYLFICLNFVTLKLIPYKLFRIHIFFIRGIFAERIHFE